MQRNISIDFFARRTHFLDHMASVWMALPPRMRGRFYIPEVLRTYALKKGVAEQGMFLLTCRNERPTSCVTPPFGLNPIVTSAYGDMEMVGSYDRRPLILMEHGVGLTFNNRQGVTNPGYGGGMGNRAWVSLFLSPNDYIAAKTRAAFPDAPITVIGTPKLDHWLEAFKHPVKRRPDNPVICVSFHWDGSGVAPEAGNAWEHYRRFLPELMKHYKVIGHGHPKFLEQLTYAYTKLGIPVVNDFEDVMQQADVYVNDCSSTMYEFLVTGKPVVVMNAPWFRKNVFHGIRFWDYSEPGPVAEGPEQLIEAIERALVYDEHDIRTRRRYVKDLYPNLGSAAKTAAHAIRDFCYDPED
jgi:hypothetical protein